MAKYLSSAAIGAGVTGASAGLLYWRTRSATTTDIGLASIPCVIAVYASPLATGLALTLTRGLSDGIAGVAGGAAVLLGMTLYRKYKPRALPASVTREVYP